MTYLRGRMTQGSYVDGDGCPVDWEWERIKRAMEGDDRMIHVDEFDGVTKAFQAIDVATFGMADPAPLIRAKCRALIIGYDKRYRNAGYIPVSVERLYEAPIVNPATNAPSRSFTAAGIVDVLAEYNGGRWLIDHKTTSMDITDPAGPYWRQLIVEGQASHYMLLLWQNGLKCDGAVWDVMRKPGISPKKLSKAEAKAASSLGEYFGSKVSESSIRELASTERESLEMYEARLAWDCTRERPDWYFQRRTIPRMDSDLLEYAGELWEHTKDMIVSRSRYKAGGQLPPRNSGACFTYGSPCKYLGLCSHYDTPESDKWERLDHVHRELPETIGKGRNVLTNSRIRCWQTCRRKEYYSYDLGLQRIDEEEKETLFMGQVWHAAQEAWWNAQTIGTKNG